MKKLNRVRRNGSSRAAASQAQNAGATAPAKPTTPRPKTVTCVWFGPDGGEFARVEFSRPLFARIERAATALNISLQQFFDNAINRYIELRTGRRAA